ncbi:hypothetical protein C8J56DRAFT_1094690 [Mycena floridula]|nr:hypothetical protein C8J56DRAFT_1094690 [Mycena floridula]
MGAAALMVQKVVKVFRTRSSSIATSAGGNVQRLSAAGSPFAGREASACMDLDTQVSVVVASLDDLFPSTTGPWLGVVSLELVAELIFTIQSRPGGVMTYALFPSNTGTTTFRLVADMTTVSDLIHDITSACSSSLNKSATSTSPVAFNDIAETRISYQISTVGPQIQYGTLAAVDCKLVRLPISVHLVSVMVPRHL